MFLQATLAQLSRTLSSSISRQPVSSQNLLHGQIGLCLQTAQLVCHSVSGICLGKSLRRVPVPQATLQAPGCNFSLQNRLQPCSWCKPRSDVLNPRQPCCAIVPVPDEALALRLQVSQAVALGFQPAILCCVVSESTALVGCIPRSNRSLPCTRQPAYQLPCGC